MREKIFDIIRRRYVAATPEESVRQHTVSLLMESFHYPLTRFSLEAGIKVGENDRRYDVLVMDREMKPFMLIECKAPDVKINDRVASQAMSYNFTLNAKYIMLTNGNETILMRKTVQGYVMQKTIPSLR